MAHITSLQSGVYSYLDLYTGDISNLNYSLKTFSELFWGSTAGTADPEHVRIPSVREFPNVGTPANIVNVPVHGQKTSSQVQGQADAPSLEVTVNYIPEEFQQLHSLKGQLVVFRFMLSAGPVTQDLAADISLDTLNTEFYWVGKIEAILVNPQLTDAITATITLSAQSDFYGPATIVSSNELTFNSELFSNFRNGAAHDFTTHNGEAS